MTRKAATKMPDRIIREHGSKHVFVICDSSRVRNFEHVKQIAKSKMRKNANVGVIVRKATVRDSFPV
jgi:hypothetical protein